MSLLSAKGTFFMQTQDGEWVKLDDPMELPVETDVRQNSVAFIIKPRAVTVTFTLRGSTRAWLRRKLLGFKGHPRIRGLMKAAKVAGIKKREEQNRR